MSTYFINGKEVACHYMWVVNEFIFDIGMNEGDLVDENGNEYFYHIIYKEDTKEFAFEKLIGNKYYDEEKCKDNSLTEHEKDVIKEVMFNLMRQV